MLTILVVDGALDDAEYVDPELASLRRSTNFDCLDGGL